MVLMGRSGVKIEGSNVPNTRLDISQAECVWLNVAPNLKTPEILRVFCFLLMTVRMCNICSCRGVNIEFFISHLNGHLAKKHTYMCSAFEDLLLFRHNLLHRSDTPLIMISLYFFMV